MARPPAYADLLHAVTLGTARRPPDPAIMAWLDDHGAIDPVADVPEQLLAALGLVERTHRLQPARAPKSEQPAAAPPETLPPPGPRLARGLHLILEGTYPDLLDEAVAVITDRGTYLPPQLLPTLLTRAATLLPDDPDRARRYLAATGERGPWLAALNPEWAPLAPGFDHAAAWRREDQPARRATLLADWRSKDPAAARAALEAGWESQSPRNQEVLLAGLRPRLSADDHPWLRTALEPKRKGVRRALTRLLLLAGEPDALRNLTAIAREAFATDRPPGNTLAAENQELLKRYGGVKAPDTVRQRLLRILPPAAWPDITALSLADFWPRLSALERREAGKAIRDHDDPETKVAFLRYLLLDEPQQFARDLAADLIAQVDDATFTMLYDEVLTRRTDALRLRGLPRFLALQRGRGWSDRLSRAMVRRLLDDLHSRQLDYATQRDLALHWKQSRTLLDPELFPWLRQQLHTTTERPDVFGKLATEILQTTSFRRQLRQA